MTPKEELELMEMELELANAPQQSKEPSIDEIAVNRSKESLKQDLGDFAKGAVHGATFGHGPEVATYLKDLVGMPHGDIRKEYEETEKRSPIATGIGKAVGSLPYEIGAGKVLGAAASAAANAPKIAKAITAVSPAISNMAYEALSPHAEGEAGKDIAIAGAFGLLPLGLQTIKKAGSKGLDWFSALSPESKKILVESKLKDIKGMEGYVDKKIASGLTDESPLGSMTSSKVLDTYNILQEKAKKLSGFAKERFPETEIQKNDLIELIKKANPNAKFNVDPSGKLEVAKALLPNHKSQASQIARDYNSMNEFSPGKNFTGEDIKPLIEKYQNIDWSKITQKPQNIIKKEFSGATNRLLKESDPNYRYMMGREDAPGVEQYTSAYKNLADKLGIKSHQEATSGISYKGANHITQAGQNMLEDVRRPGISETLKAMKEADELAGTNTLKDAQLRSVIQQSRGHNPGTITDIKAPASVIGGVAGAATGGSSQGLTNFLSSLAFTAPRQKIGISAIKAGKRLAPYSESLTAIQKAAVLGADPRYVATRFLKETLSPNARKENNNKTEYDPTK